jgi:4'-phosphopantetheinyl transferase EntD
VIDAVVPGTFTAEAFGEVLDEPLFPQEEAAVCRAVAKRRAEFRTVRACARRALAQLGVERPPLVPGSQGAPPWPPGFVGSMTHCTGYRAASVARRDRMLAIGIDAEPDEPLPRGVLGMVASPEERAWLDELVGTRPGVAWDRLLFSAKESVYKVWHPLTGRWLGFDDVAVSIDAIDGRFTARFLLPGPRVEGRPLARLDGRWTACRGLVVTGITVAANIGRVMRNPL